MGYLGDGVSGGEGEERGKWVPRTNKMKHVCDHSVGGLADYKKM